MNKDYFITLGIGIAILLVVSVLFTGLKTNQITGAATTPTAPTVSTLTPPQTQPTPTNVPSLTPPIVVGSTQVHQVPTFTFQQPGQPAQTVPPIADPGNIAKGRAPQGAYVLDGVPYVEYDNKIYAVPNYGNTWVQVNPQTWDVSKPLQTIAVAGSGVRVTTATTVVFQDFNGNRLASTPASINPGLATQFIVSSDGKSLVSQDGTTVVLSQDGSSLVLKNDKGETTKEIIAVGNAYVVCSGSLTFDCDVASNPQGTNLIGSFPSGLRLQDLAIDQTAGTVTYVDSTRLGTRTATYVADKSGAVTTTVRSNDAAKTLVSQEVHYPDGSYSQAQIQNGQVQTVPRYNAEGELIAYTALEGVTYYISKDGKSVYTDPNNIQKTTLPLSDLNADVQNAITSNEFWTGRSNAAKVGQFIANLDQTYGGLNDLLGGTSWLTKWRSGWDGWRSKVEREFTKNYLGIDATISNICTRWTDDKTTGPSSIAFGENGLPAAHIEGEREISCSDVYGVSGTSECAPLRRVYIYKITFSVNPLSALQHADDLLTFEVKARGQSGEGPVRLDQSNPNSFRVAVRGDHGEVRVDGTNMIVRESENDYNEVCLDFTASEDHLDGRFRSFLRGSRLCNSLTDLTTPSLPTTGATGHGLAETTVRTLTLGLGGSGSTNDNNQQGTNPQQETVPSSQNTGQPSSGGGI